MEICLKCGKPKQEPSYLSEMLKVYKEAFKSGISPLVTVTKNPTKKGKLRRLDLDTARLLEMAGYQIIDYHRAILWKEIEQKTLAGGIKKEQKGRISFFKRLSVQKGNVAAKWEDVLIAVIPNLNSGTVGVTSPPYFEGVQIDRLPSTEKSRGGRDEV